MKGLSRRMKTPKKKTDDRHWRCRIGWHQWRYGDPIWIRRKCLLCETEQEECLVKGAIGMRVKWSAVVPVHEAIRIIEKMDRR